MSDLHTFKTLVNNIQTWQKFFHGMALNYWLPLYDLIGHHHVTYCPHWEIPFQSKWCTIGWVNRTISSSSPLVTIPNSAKSLTGFASNICLFLSWIFKSSNATVQEAISSIALPTSPHYFNFAFFFHETCFILLKDTAFPSLSHLWPHNFYHTLCIV